jgi:hypothetical protein
MVRCADCGFLATIELKTRRLGETEERNRKTGTGWGDGATFDRMPVCVAKEISFKDQLPNANDAEIAAVLAMERECKSFTPWKQGFTPKEHREMIENQELRAWQERQEEQRKATQCWQEEQREKDLRRQEDQRREDQRLQEERRRSDRRWQVSMIALAAVLGLFFSFVQGKLNPPRSDPPRPSAAEK